MRGDRNDISRAFDVASRRSTSPSAPARLAETGVFRVWRRICPWESYSRARRPCDGRARAATRGVVRLLSLRAIRRLFSPPRGHLLVRPDSLLTSRGALTTPPRYPSPQLNSKRLKAYKASLILFPRRTAKPKHGDSEAAELNMARQLKGKLMPITKEDKPLEMVAVTEEMKGFNAYQKLRVERMNVWQVGPRLKKAEEAAKKAEEDAKVAKMK